jgi:HEAT repeat protein
MLSTLNNFHFDLISFWIGFISALIVWWIISKGRSYWPEIIAPIKKQIEISARKATAGIKERLNQETLRRAQGMHLAAPLFSLDEVFISPRLISPLPQINPNDPYPYEDVIHPILPYLPDWPELAGQLNGPTLGIVQALQGDANIAIIGQPGSGKTVALASLATQLARADSRLGKLADFVPVFLHVSDLDYSEQSITNSFEAIIAAEQGYLSPMIASQASTFLRRSAQDGQIFLLLDGADELSCDQMKSLTTFITALLTQRPRLRLLLAASPDYLDGLISLGVVPLALCSWDEAVTNRFLERWGALWTEFIEPGKSLSVNPPTISPILIENWISGQTTYISPMELTLKIWAAYACDAFGPKSTDSMDSYFRRLISDAKVLPFLEKIVLEMLTTQQSTLSIHQAEIILAESNFNTGSLVGSGILTRRSNGVAFLHPALMGYLAGQVMNDPQQLVELTKQPVWIGKVLGLHYAALSKDLSLVVNALLENDHEDPLNRNLFMISRWLPDIPPNTPWRSQIMRQLVNIIKRESAPLSLRARGLAAILTSKDASAVVLFRQLLISNFPAVRLLAALGCGALRDIKSVNDLVGCLTDPEQSVRQAAGLALISLDTLGTLDAIKLAITRGDENLGRLTALTLAERLPIRQMVLNSWSQDENLLIRRASVYGLEMIGEQWAEEMLEKMSIEEGEWIVRNAAGQSLENRRKPEQPHIPRTLPDPHNVPWLISYASRQGIGISPAKPVTPILVSALNNGSLAEQQAALDYLSMVPDPDPGSILSIYRLAYHGQGFICDIAFYALWRMAVAGIALPSPVEFGMAASTVFSS